MVSIIYLWMIVAVFARMGLRRKFAAWGTTFLMGIPFIFAVNLILSKMIAEPVVDVWDMLSVFILSAMAFISFICSYAKKKEGN